MHELEYLTHPLLVNLLQSQTITQIVDKIKQLPKKSTIYLYAPVVRGRKGEYKKEILNYKKRGFRKIKLMMFYMILKKFLN